MKTCQHGKVCGAHPTELIRGLLLLKEHHFEDDEMPVFDEACVYRRSEAQTKAKEQFKELGLATGKLKEAPAKGRTEEDG